MNGIIICTESYPFNPDGKTGYMPKGKMFSIDGDPIPNNGKGGNLYSGIFIGIYNFALNKITSSEKEINGCGGMIIPVDKLKYYKYYKNITSLQRDSKIEILI